METQARELKLDDLLGADTGPPESVVKKMRDSHHAVARLLAEGKRVEEVALITGYSPGRIATLKGDQSFQELLIYYRERQEEIFVSVTERLAQLGGDVVQELQTRLDEQPEAFTVGQLNELMKSLMDRTGNGPTSTQKHEHRHILSAEDIEKIRRSVSGGEILRLADAQKDSRVNTSFIDITPEVPETTENCSAKERVAV